ncbi:MAG: hypothetical protein GX085_01770 [Firmicutes bacterium]|nr:hypothetical protein [Bacillota bacterium]
MVFVLRQAAAYRHAVAFGWRTGVEERLPGWKNRGLWRVWMVWYGVGWQDYSYGRGLAGHKAE